MAVFLLVVVAIGYFISYYYNDPAIVIIAVIFALVMNVTSYWYSDKISLSLARAVPAKREENLELFQVIENLSITAGLPMPKVYIIPDPAPNAFATGRDKDHASVAVTSGLLGMMDKNELSGVMAHELSHIGNRDILLSTVVVVLVGFISILAYIFTRSMFLGGIAGGRRGGNNRNGGGQLGLILAVVGIVFVILSPIVAQLIQLAISRRRESLADADGALLTRYPEGLASALEKIEGYGKPMATANNATAHLYISNPFGQNASKGMAKLFMTHPPTEERIKALRAME